jgi:hypothetical protein
MFTPALALIPVVAAFAFPDPPAKPVRPAAPAPRAVTPTAAPGDPPRSTADLAAAVANKVRGKTLRQLGIADSDVGFPSDYTAAKVLLGVDSHSQAGDVQWSATRKTPLSVKTLDYTSWSNATSQTHQYQQTLSESFTETFSWSTTTALDVGVSVELSVGVPGEFGVTGTVSSNLSVSKTDNQEKQNTNSVSRTVIVNIAPQTSVYAAMLVYPIQSDATWRAAVVVDGPVGLYGNLLPVVTRLSKILSPAERTMYVSGTVKGIMGADFRTCTQEYAVGGTRPSTADCP